MNQQTESFDQWAIVEVMGHRTFAGRVTEQVIGGASFVRVDVPQIGDRQAFCKLLGAASIYAITPVSEAVARETVARLRSEVLPVYCPSVNCALPFRDEMDEDEDL